MRSFGLVIGVRVFVSLFLLQSIANAQNTGTTVFPQQERDALIRPQESRHSFSLQNSQYVNYGQNYYRAGAADNNLSFALKLNEVARYKSVTFKVSAKNEFSATENWNYADVYDLYGEINLGNLKIAAGRKLDRWSEWENDWRQGLFQPRYLENRLRPELAGLTGIFLARQEDSWSATLGLLPISIPDFGAHFTVENDKFVSRNPWFNPPASKFVFQDVPGDLRYSVETPDTGKIVGHPGAAAKIEFRNQGYFARLSAAYKPASQLMLGFPSRNQFAIRATESYMSIRITPRVIYQRVVNLDQVVRAGSWTLGSSFSYENPQDDISEYFTAAAVRPATIAALSASRPLEVEGKNAARVHFGFLKISGGDSPDRGEFAQGEGQTLFERRYQYSEAYSLGLTKPWRGVAGNTLETGMKLIYDRLQNGGVASFNLGMNFSKDLRADLEVDYLGLFEGGAEIVDGFLAEYRANDRVGLGISYVF